MLVLNVGFLTFLYIMSGLALMLGLWWYYDRRDSRRHSSALRMRVHHCVKCDHLYSATSEDAAAPCPACGFVNSPLQF